MCLAELKEYKDGMRNIGGGYDSVSTYIPKEAFQVIGDKFFNVIKEFLKWWHIS